MTKTDEDAPTKANKSLVNHVRSQLSSLSPAEKKIGELLVQSPQKFSGMSVRDVAAELSVSEPTVVRFCRNVGCDGYKDLKFRLIQEVAIQQATQDAGAASAVLDYQGPSSPHDADAPAHCYHSALQALEHVWSSLDAAQIKQAAERVIKSRKVAIFGLGGSSSVLALEMHNRLFRLGIVSTPYTDSYQQRMAAATFTADDSAIFISSTGRPRALLDSVELAKYYGADCIGIAPRASALAREMDVCLHVELTQSGVYQIQPNPMRFGQLLAIDILSFEIALALGDVAEERLQRTRASVASLHGIAPQQPIGD